MVRLRLPIPSPPPSELKVEGELFHYLVRVLRLAEGDGLEVFDGHGARYPARVLRLSAAEAVLSLGEPLHARVLRPLTLLVGLPKADKLEWVLQKGTELGASAFAPVACARSVARVTGDRAASKLARWEKIASEAARQCGRSDVPAVRAPEALADAAAALAPGTYLVVLDEEERHRTLTQAFAAAPHDAPLAAVVGPEGGLTREEVAALRDRGAVTATLGTRILRAETAAIAAIALLRHLDGELG